MSSDLYETGMAVRRAVLGDEYVERSINGADELGAPLQRLITEYCWGAVWAREGLPRQTRSLANVAMLTALNRPHELRLHIEGAFNNGVSVAEVAEMILQAAIYCGVPAALESMRVLREVLAGREEAAVANG